MARSRGASMMDMISQLTELVGPNRAIAPMIIPPDGGWGWVIVMVGLLSSCLVDGIICCFYLFREPMTEELKVAEADISYLSSLNTGFYFVGAVIACSFGNHWGFRMTMILGAIATSFSYASGYILQEMIYYQVIIGVIAGLGSGFVAVGGGLPAGFYFDKKRSIAMGIVACGSGLGGLVSPLVVEKFMHHYGWRNTFLFEGGLLALNIFLGILVRPLRPVMVVIDVETSHMTLRGHEDSSIVDYSAFRVPPLPLPDTYSFSSNYRTVLPVGESTLPAEPTIAQMMADDTSLINIRVKEFSDPTVITRLNMMSQSRRTSRMQQPSASLENILISQEPWAKRRLLWYKCSCCRSKYVSIPERPLMRNDLYYTGSLLRLSEYTGRDRDLEYHMQVTRVPTYYQTVQDLTKNYTTWCCNNIFTGLGYLVDFKMFKSFAFICLALCGFGIYVAFYLPYVFCKVHLDEVGAASYASELISVIGLGTMIGRLLSGLIITACPMFDARTVVTFMTLVSGVAITAMVLQDNLFYKGVCLFIFGFGIGFFVPLRSLIIVDYFGLERLTSATGVLIICVACGSFLGPPLAEFVMDYTQNMRMPFIVCGLSLLFASVSLMPMKRLNLWQKKLSGRKKTREMNMARSRASMMDMMTQLTEVVGPNRAIAPMIVPPDGRWGWVIVMVGLLSTCCSDGCIFCLYLFREPMSEELKISASDISYLSSLTNGFYFVGAIFACSFGNQWGFRMTMILGATVTSLSYVTGYILQEMIYYNVIVGVLAGFGSGFIAIAGSLPAGFYFDKKRSIALGIVSCGSGLGGMVMPQIVERFMHHYGWRNTFLFEGGILASVIFLGTLIRPLKPVMVVIDVESSHMTLRACEDSIMDISVFRIPPVQPPDVFSFTSIGGSFLPVGESTLPVQPTIAQMADDISGVIRVRSENPSIITRLQELTQSRRTSQVLQPTSTSAWFSNIHITQEPFVKQRLPWYKCGCCRSKYVTLPERPLMRNDLYYTGSLRRLPQYTGKDRDLEYHMHVTRVPTYYQTVQDLTRNYTIWCCHNIFTGLGYLVDYKMFKSLAFTCLAFCGFGVYVAFYLPYLFCKVHLEEQGAGSHASTMVSLIGLGTLIGRLLSGLIITACPRFDARLVVIVMMLVSSVAITVMVLYDNLYFKGVCLFIFGFTIGFYVPLRSLIIVDYFGLEKLTTATGVLIICVACGAFLGPPLSENAMQYTHNTGAPFYVCGISLLFASVSLLPMKWLNKWEKNRAERKKNRGRRQI